MATGYSSADRLRDQDFTRSHRTPPAIPSSPSLRSPPPTSSAAARNQREAFSAAVATAIGNRSEPHLPDHHINRANTTAVSKPVAWPIPDEEPRDTKDSSSGGLAARGARSRAATTSEGVREGSGRPRRGSFNFLKRTNTNSSRKGSLDQPERTYYTAEPTAPPLPKTLFAQVQQEAALSRPSQDINSTSGSMLRKVSGMGSSRKKQEEQERLKREAAAAALPRQPPHLPSLSPLPGMSPFSEERPDSVAIFNHSYTTSPTSQLGRPTANFSRPSQQNMPSSSVINSSSSPGYSSGRTDSGLNSSSPSTQYAKANGIHSSGEYVATDILPDSMTNRGRFSYASSATNVNSFNSPRRIRRKKDPTPFK